MTTRLMKTMAETFLGASPRTLSLQEIDELLSKGVAPAAHPAEIMPDTILPCGLRCPTCETEITSQRLYGVVAPCGHVADVAALGAAMQRCSQRTEAVASLRDIAQRSLNEG